METQQKGKALYVVLALVLAAVIAGGATWFYLSGTDADNKTAQTSESATTETEAPKTAESTLDTSLKDLDGELAAIEVDEESEDDTVDF